MLNKLSSLGDIGLPISADDLISKSAESISFLVDIFWELYLAVVEIKEELNSPIDGSGSNNLNRTESESYSEAELELTNYIEETNIESNSDPKEPSINGDSDQIGASSSESMVLNTSEGYIASLSIDTSTDENLIRAKRMSQIRKQGKSYNHIQPRPTINSKVFPNINSKKRLRFDLDKNVDDSEKKPIMDLIQTHKNTFEMTSQSWSYQFDETFKKPRMIHSEGGKANLSDIDEPRSGLLDSNELPVDFEMDTELSSIKSSSEDRRENDKSIPEKNLLNLFSQVRKQIPVPKFPLNIKKEVYAKQIKFHKKALDDRIWKQKVELVRAIIN